MTVTNGLFTTQLDFGASAFTGDARYLEVRVRPGSSTGAYTTLSPRQQLTATPYALALPGLYTQQNATSPNLIGGYSGNSVTNNVVGATISGGGASGFTNRVTDDYGTVGGGSSNRAGNNDATTTNASFATVGGGLSNTASANYATVGGGWANTASGLATTVGGGWANIASGNSATVSGGTTNTASGYYATVGGGMSNTAAGDYSFVVGRRAKNDNAAHDGVFIFADSTNADFSSTAANQFLVRASGGMGVGTNNPVSQLHVLEAVDGIASNLGDHIAVLENNSATTTNGPDVLALKVTNVTTPTASVNYITFFDANGAIAAVDGNGAGGVTYKTSGADLAEYLPLRTRGERIAPGDIVGVLDGRLTKQTAGAHYVFVASSAAGFVGNMPRDEITADVALVALTGQAKIKVRGVVRAGDFIVPSGANDGFGIAVGLEDLTAEQAAQIVGRALESGNGGEVNALVGLPRDAVWAALLQQKDTRISALEARLAALESVGSTANAGGSSTWGIAAALLIGALGVVGYARVRRGGGK